MLPTRLELRNFTSYIDQCVDLTGVKMAALVGPNGAGKSSLLDALTWALFGEGTKGGTRALDNYVRRGEAEGAVALEFLLHDQVYRVERIRNVGKQRTSLRLLHLVNGEGRWHDVGGKSVPDTQAAIERLIRMDYRTFTASALILQGKADVLTADMTDQERKEVLARILGLDLWDRLLEAAKERLQTTRARQEALRSQRDATQAEALEAGGLAEEVRHCKNRLEVQGQVNSDLEAAILYLQEQVARGPALESRQRELRASVDALKREHLDHTQAAIQAEQQIKNLETLLSRRDEIRNAATRANALRDEVAHYEEIGTKAITLTRQLERRLKDFHQAELALVQEHAWLEISVHGGDDDAEILGTVPCVGTDMHPRCQLLAKAREAKHHADEVRPKLDAFDLDGRRTSLRQPIEALQQERDAIGYDEHAHIATRDAFNAVLPVAQLIPHLEAAEQRVADLRTTAALAWSRNNEVAGRIEGLLRELEETDGALQALEQTRHALHERQQMLAAGRTYYQVDLEQLGRLKHALEIAQAAAARVGGLEADLQMTTAELLIFSVLVEACGKRGGVPALIVEAAVPEIERLANQLLSRMAGGRLAVRLDTQHETKAGTTAEVLRIVVLDEGAERPYQTYSGAERFMVDLALRVALSKFLAHRAGAEIRLLVLDEGLGALDNVNRQAIVETIQTVGQEFACVLVISHISDIQDAFGQRVEVTRNGNGSQVRVLA